MLPSLDATRLCARWSPDSADAWARPVPVRPRTAPPSAEPGYSWRALLRNPQALAVTGVVAALVTVEGTAARLRRG